MATTALDFTTPHLLRDNKEYQAAIEAIDDLLDMNPRAGTEEYARLDFLSVLVEAYEDRVHPIGPSSPQELVTFYVSTEGHVSTEGTRPQGFKRGDGGKE